MIDDHIAKFALVHQLHLQKSAHSRSKKQLLLAMFQNRYRQISHCFFVELKKNCYQIYVLLQASLTLWASYEGYKFLICYMNKCVVTMLCVSSQTILWMRLHILWVSFQILLVWEWVCTSTFTKLYSPMHWLAVAKWWLFYRWLASSPYMVRYATHTNEWLMRSLSDL